MSQNFELETLQGVFLNVAEIGLALTGAAGCGKSSIALEMIRQGHQLVADDVITLNPTTVGEIWCSCPELLQDFLAVRSLGVLNIRKIFGDQAICEGQFLDLVIKISASGAQSQDEQVLGCPFETISILEVEIPMLKLYPMPGCSMATLIETAARELRQQQQGYLAADALAERLKNRIERQQT